MIVFQTLFVLFTFAGCGGGSGSDGGGSVLSGSDTWSHQAYLKAPNNSNVDWFGFSVAVSGDTVVAGAPYEDSNTTAIINGAAYVFVR